MSSVTSTTTATDVITTSDDVTTSTTAVTASVNDVTSTAANDISTSTTAVTPPIDDVTTTTNDVTTVVAATNIIASAEAGCGTTTIISQPHPSAQSSTAETCAKKSSATNIYGAKTGSDGRSAA